MKKILAGILVCALVLTLGMTTVFAHGGRGHHSWKTASQQGNRSVCDLACPGCGDGANFVDADGNGICDNCGTNARYVDADGDGVCDNCGKGFRYTDADGDGICDNCVACSNYTDTDGNGICDNWENGTRPQNGTGAQRGHHCGRA